MAETNVPPDAVLGYLPPEPDDPLWWLSFCDPDLAPPLELQRPGGPSFLGAVITQAPTMAAAITRSHMLKVNPGGEIKIAGPIPAGYIAAEWRDRLLSAAEIGSMPEPEIGLPRRRLYPRRAGTLLADPPVPGPEPVIVTDRGVAAGAGDRR